MRLKDMGTIIDQSDAECVNSHWIGDYPAWDILLSNGTTHKSVTERDISRVLVKMYNHGLIRNGEQYVCGVVRQCHITSYNKWFTDTSEATRRRDG